MLCVALLVLGSGCSRHAEDVPLSAPFDRDARVGSLTASWKSTGEERVAPGPGGASRPEERFEYRAAVKNRLSDQLFVRLGSFRLTGPDGSEIARDPKRVECVLAAGARMEILAGSIWVPQSSVPEVSGFRVSHFAVPLNALGQALYKQWRLENRPPVAEAEAEEEVARYAGAPRCIPAQAPADGTPVPAQ